MQQRIHKIGDGVEHAGGLSALGEAPTRRAKRVLSAARWRGARGRSDGPAGIGHIHRKLILIRLAGTGAGVVPLKPLFGMPSARVIFGALRMSPVGSNPAILVA